MKPLQLLFAVAALAFVAGQYFQERKQLSRVATMNPRDARRYYEQRRRGHDRLLLVITAGFVTAAVGSSIYAQYFHR